MMSSDYAFNGAMRSPWLVTSGEELTLGGQTADAFQQGNWEDWMKWDPNGSQAQSPRPLNPNAQGPYCDYLKPRTQRPGLNRRPNGEHPVTSAPQQSLQSRLSGTPFTFSESADGTPAFQFESSALSSPPVTEGLQGTSYFNDTPVWNQNQVQEGGIFSPVSYEQPQQPRPATTTQPQSTPSLQHSPDSATSNIRTASTSSQSSPEPPPPAPTAKKRKSSTDEEQGDSKGSKQPPIKKTAHNMIEKRYRTNLNDKIAALRDSVPSLRVMSRSGNNEEDDDAEDLEGLTPAHKLNKATVLSKATEYIRHLEKRNKRLTEELAAAKARIETYEKLSMTNPMAMTNPVTTPDGMRYQDDPFGAAAAQGSPVTQGNPQGMIPVPESMANLHRGLPNQPHYAQPGYPVYGNIPGRPVPQGQRQVANGRNGGLAAKLMVGSLAGLMVLDGFYEKEKSGEEPAGRGLFALPFHLLGRLAGLVDLRAAAHHLLPYMSLLKVYLGVGVFLYIMWEFFGPDSKPKSKKKPMPIIKLSSAPSLASPVEVRQKAWLTSIQTVWVPKHNFFLEAAALALKGLKLTARRMIGWHAYSLITGITNEQEVARVKAWDIALGAQLTGGDAEISMSRLLLTIMASGTLPDTPARMMLKALHIRVFLWELLRGTCGELLFHDFSVKFARSYWNEARLKHKISVNSPSQTNFDDDNVEKLPEHLAVLLEQECDDVLVDSIVQRARNLAWNKPSAQSIEADESMDSVVEDFAISSPLDALAARWSSYTLRKVLINDLQASSDESEKIDNNNDLELAVATAPPASGAQARALATKAVLLPTEREKNINAALEALPSSSHATSTARALTPARTLLNAVGDSPVATDVRQALTFAKCLSLAEHSVDSPASEAARSRATSVVNTTILPESSISLLSFVAAYKVLFTFSSDDALLADSKLGLERLASSMRVWIGREANVAGAGPGARGRVGLVNKTRAAIVESCLEVSKSLTGMKDVVEVSTDEDAEDAGYVSQEDPVPAVKVEKF